MKKDYTDSHKKLFLNNRFNEYFLFLKGINAGIALDNKKFKVDHLSVKFSALPLCKAI